MSIAVTEDHRVLAKTVADFLAKHQARAMARRLLESDEERLPAFWTELAGLGLLGIHLPEELGGAGFTLSEVLVVAEQLGRAVAPGPFVPTVITSALIAAAAPED
ncbi:MAG TPA: acyl-CoA dehydrogenase family protein, partial [Streptosporangiaceae bacterium]|nr:acyl-CoA dehydrogenase family protein [Streptosporangiaceae bacterium]